MPTRRLLLAAAAMALAAGAARADAQAKTETEYFAVLMAGKKIGHGESVRQIADGKVTTTQKQVMTVARGGVGLTIRQLEVSVETVDGKPLSFKSVQDFGLMAQTVEGVVDSEGTMRVKVSAGGQTVERTMPWPEGALMVEGQRLLSLKTGFKEGTKYSTKVFMGALLKPLDMEVTVGPKVDVDLLGRVVKLTEVKAIVKAPTGELPTTTYVNRRGDALKSVASVLGMQMEVVSCSRQFALSANGVLDFFDRLLVPSPRALEGIGKAAAATYHLSPTAGTKLNVPATDSQAVRPGAEGAVIVTVRPVAPPPKAPLPYKGKDPAALGALKPTRFLQSDDQKVAALARKAVSGSKDAAEAAGRIEAFVAKYIHKKDLSVGYASAAEVAASRQGDCTEHAVLTAAMCRAAGIPAQVVCGLIYADRFAGKQHIFGPHAWTQALIGGRWIGLDATRGRGGFGAGHIALLAGNGDLDEFFGMLSTLGCFEIKTVELSK